MHNEAFNSLTLSQPGLVGKKKLSIIFVVSRMFILISGSGDPFLSTDVAPVGEEFINPKKKSFHDLIPEVFRRAF